MKDPFYALHDHVELSFLTPLSSLLLNRQIAKLAAVLVLANLSAPAFSAQLRRGLQTAGVCQRKLETILETTPDFDPVATCTFTPVDENGNGFPDRYTGCWFDGGFAEDFSGELVDEYCECYLAYEMGCMSKVPFGELPGPADNQRPLQWSQLVSGDGMTPTNLAKYCEFAGVWTGDFSVTLDEDMTMCGCLWIDMVEDFIDECPGVEYVPPTEDITADTSMPVAASESP